MALIVQKFGGTSVGSIDRIQHVARWALDSEAKGNQIVLVVSAMAGETNRLVQLAKQIHPDPYSREYDMLVASGEQVSIGLVSLAINTEAKRRGLIPEGEYKSRPFLAYQLGIRTTGVFSKARIQEIKTECLQNEIIAGAIPVIAGFQGVDSENNITTLGRGGTDTSAVAIAAALGAEECEIYTDVDGVYSTDPRLYSGAKKIREISYEEMMELASLGTKVLQTRSVEVAAKYGVSIHVRSSFDPVEGTKVVPKEKLSSNLEKVVVSGVAADRNQVKLTLQNLPDQPGVASEIFGELAKRAVIVDVIVQDVSSDGVLNLSFTVHENDHLKAKKIIDEFVTRFSKMRVVEEADLSKVSIVGVGMQHNPGVAAEMFRLLAEADINIKLITTSEIKVSCLIDSRRIEDAVRKLHQGFRLDEI